MDFKSFLAVSPDVLESLDKIMETGARGTHLLFSNRMIREAFRREEPMKLLADNDFAEEVQNALSDLLTLEDLDDRQEYIELLDRTVRDILVHIYFGFLDRYVNPEEKSKNRQTEVFH